MIRKIALAVLALVAVFAAVVAMQPAEFKVERSLVIAAPPADLFAQVNDFHKWVNWSPWENLDASMKKTFSGTPSGPGSVYEWNGNDKVGSGRMTLTESIPTSLVRIKLEFFKPFEANNITGFIFTPEGAGTKVTWNMSGNNNFIAKAAGLFMNMDKIVGGDFEKGLSQLKAAVEGAKK